MIEKGGGLVATGLWYRWGQCRNEEERFLYLPGFMLLGQAVTSRLLRSVYSASTPSHTWRVIKGAYGLVRSLMLFVPGVLNNFQTVAHMACCEGVGHGLWYPSYPKVRCCHAGLTSGELVFQDNWARYKINMVPIQGLRGHPDVLSYLYYS